MSRLTSCLMCALLITISVGANTVRAATPTTNRQTACSELASAEFFVEMNIPVELGGSHVVAGDGKLPAYCAVSGFVAPQVGFEVRLPLQGWNGRFLQQGCSGMCGHIEIDAADDALARGYAVASTDMGHRSVGSKSAMWAYYNPSAKRDFWYRGTHVATLAAKQIVADYYGTAPRRAYHRGCGTGGRAGLIEAQRFPDDFDGIITTGAAVLNFVHNNFSLVWTIRANQAPNGEPILARPDLELIHAAVMAQCANDSTGILANPLACDFDPGALACDNTTTKASACLTAEKVEAVRKIYDGPRNSTGKQIYLGLSKGSELAWERPYFGNPSVMERFTTPIWRYLLFSEPPGPSFELADVDFDLPMERFQDVLAAAASDRVDYEGFKARGGKVLMVYGWNESSMPGPNAPRYFDRVANANGGVPATQDFFRLFMVPGQFVCVRGSPTGRDVDLLTAMEAWSEQGIAPQRIIATRQAQGGTAANSRPLFPYPSYASYSGKGSADDADNYVEVRSQ